MTLSNPQATAIAATGSYAWTRGQVAVPFRSEPFADIVGRVKAGIAAKRLVIPDLDQFVGRAVAALLAGHVILQGPPGTGKTTVARVLAEAFEANLEIVTATSEWSTYDVIGGLQPSLGGGFAPTLGAASRAVLACAESVLADTGVGIQATWLLIDEFNRADIDKAIGPLYTVLSSTAGVDLDRTPMDLWFERGARRELWVPSRFRIIGTMNDVDTSFVNALSQGLTRRFQFISLPTEVGAADDEVAAVFEQASERWLTERGVSVSGDYANVRAALVGIVGHLRDPDRAAWPLGTAQVLDVWRAVLIHTDGTENGLHGLSELDEAVAAIIVPQAANLSLAKLLSIRESLDAAGLPEAAMAVGHLENTSATHY